MDNNNYDTFELNKSNKFAENGLQKNFFVTEPEQLFHDSKRRINDYDFNLLKEDAYKDVADELFKLEYKISETEEKIKMLDKQIQTAKDVGNSAGMVELEAQKATAKKDYEDLISVYNTRSLSAKITDTVSKTIKNNFSGISESLSKLSDVIVSKLPPKIAKIFEIRKSLAKLENINKSVDELMALKVPYGENIDKYQQLSKYIIRANAIHAKISKYI